MANEPALLIERDPCGIVSLILNRPQRHNAFDDQLINDLINALTKLALQNDCRVLILKANGENFSAGADLNWMQRMASYSEDDNYQDARQLAKLMRLLNEFPKPCIAEVQGSAFGGGVGLIACCDIAVASSNAAFCFSETRIGLIPAVISPYIINAMGERAVRRYFLTAEKFSAQTALHFGLLHKVVEKEKLTEQCLFFAKKLLNNGPQALTEAKLLIQKTSGRVIDEPMRQYTAMQIAKMRVSEQGQEGLNAFLEKRKPAWIKDDN